MPVLSPWREGERRRGGRRELGERTREKEKERAKRRGRREGWGGENENEYPTLFGQNSTKSGQNNALEAGD